MATIHTPPPAPNLNFHCSGTPVLHDRLFTDMVEEQFESTLSTIRKKKMAHPSKIGELLMVYLTFKSHDTKRLRS